MNEVKEAYYVENIDTWSDIPSEGGVLRYVFDHPLKGLIDVDEGIKLKEKKNGNGWERRLSVKERLEQTMGGDIMSFIDNMSISDMRSILIKAMKQVMNTNEESDLKKMMEILIK